MRQLIVYFTLIAVIGCDSDPDVVPDLPDGNAQLLIANEGNFGWGEGTLSVYDLEEKTIANNVFKSRNNHAIGNVFQSINKLDSTYYFVVNNSGKIVLTDDEFFKQAEIEGLQSPRYIYPINSTKAYVTDLYANGVHIVDLTTNKLTGKIGIPGWTEKGMVVGGEFWVCGKESDKVYQIDISTDLVVDSIQVSYGAESIIQVSDGSYFVLCVGDEIKSISPALVKLNEASLEVDTIYDLTGVRPSELTYMLTSNTFYFIQDDVMQFSVDDERIESFIEADANSFYALGLVKDELFVSDALDYTQRSTIYRYSTDGTKIDEFKAGVISTAFYSE